MLYVVGNSLLFLAQCMAEHQYFLKIVSGIFIFLVTIACGLLLIWCFLAEMFTSSEFGYTEVLP